MRTLYVNVYQVERCYGGAEEGGWWYDSYTPLESETAECSCNLPVSEWPVQNDRGDFVGWHAELDTWSGRHDSFLPGVRSRLGQAPCYCQTQQHQ